MAAGTSEKEDYVIHMGQDLPSGVAYDSQHDFNPFFATLAVPGAGVRSSE